MQPVIIADHLRLAAMVCGHHLRLASSTQAAPVRGRHVSVASVGVSFRFGVSQPVNTEFRSCVKVEVAVLGSRS